MVNGTPKKVTQQVRCMHFDPHPVTISDWQADWCGVLLGQMTINILSDDELLCIFDCYVAEAPNIEVWHTLIHVCQRWRNIVFGSPRRLNLRIACKSLRPVRKKLDVWPAIPIVIFAKFHSETRGLDNIKAAFELNERVSQIDLIMRHPLDVLDVFAALEKPFPALTDLKLGLTRPSDSISQSSQVLGWLYPSTIAFVNFHSDARITEATSVLHRPC
jgi:hypothetical protein